MTQVFLTTADTSPWTVPGDFTAAGHTVELIGAGGNGAAGTTGTSGNGGGGGSGGNYLKLVYSSGTVGSTIIFRVGVAGEGNVSNDLGSLWEATTFVNCYRSGSGGNASGTTGGTVTAANESLSPPIVYTKTANLGGTGGSTGKNLGGGGGGAAANIGGVGGNGSAPNTTTGFGGGGSAGRDSSGGSSGSQSGGVGDATGGGVNGGAGGSVGKNSTGSAGGNGTAWTASYGSGSGGGGSGSDTANETSTSTGGAGGLYGGGGGGCGYCRGTGSSFVAGAGKNGLIVITYTPVATVKSIVYLVRQAVNRAASF